MTPRKLIGHAILVLLVLLLFCSIANDVGWERALTVAGAVLGATCGFLIAAWLIAE